MEHIELKMNDLSGLDQIWELSKKIFDPSATELKAYHDAGDWRAKIENGGLLVAAYDNGIPVGFVICYPKDGNTLHLWVGGVLQNFRKKGVWSAMYLSIEKYAAEKGFKRLTLNTYQEKFPVMYRFATKNGFHVYSTEMNEGLEKSKFEKDL